MPFARQCLADYASRHQDASFQAYFVDRDPQQTSLNGTPLISEREFFELPCEERLFNVAISDSRLRERLVGACLARDARPLALRAASAQALEFNEVGEGALISGNTLITANVVIGRYFHLNYFSYVAHECVIGDFVTFAPGVRCNGNVKIGDHPFIGAGAVLRDGMPGKPLTIGEGAVVGMGAVVTRDVAPYTTVVGNPARPLVKTSC
ncbi:MAG: acetyltransferase [Pseudomonadota bacterium]|nr:acetyltransferase [Pseudomonadota bacterium]